MRTTHPPRSTGSPGSAPAGAPPGVQRYFEVSLLLTLGTGFFTLASTGKLDPISVAAFAIALLARLWSFARGADWILAPRTVTRISILYVLFYPLDVLFFASGPGAVDRMLEATVHLILFATVVKVFSARTHRDYGYLATLSFLMMLASAVLTVSTLYLAGFALYLLFAISTFISYEIKRSAEAAGGGIRDSALEIREGRNPGLKAEGTAIDRALMGTASGLAGGIVAVATLLFFLIPRYRSGYLNGVGMQTENVTGFSASVDLGDIRKVLESSAVVMRVMPDGNLRDFQGVKWRGVGLTSFDGKRWYDDNTEQTPLAPVSLNHFALPLAEEAGRGRPRRLLRYRVLLSPISSDVLFAAAVPREITGQLRFLFLDQTGSLHNAKLGAAPFSYEAISESATPSPDELRRADTDYPLDIRRVYLGVPRLDPQVAELARQITVGAATSYDRTAAIRDYLRDHFGYTLDPPSIDPADPIGSFLFKSRQGYCEYFAASMALMVRTLGIPSRVVNGFQTGSYNPIGKDFVVRARDAHSWVEVYFPGNGWIPFDPTPPDPRAVTGLGALDDYLDAVNLFWSEWVVNYDFTHQVRLAQQVQSDSQNFQESMQRRWRRFERQGTRTASTLEERLILHRLAVLSIMAAVLGLLALTGSDVSVDRWRWFWAWRFRRRESSLDPRAATLAYQQFLKTLGRRGFRKPPSQTPQEFAATLATTPLNPPVMDFTRLYNALRFGGAPVSIALLREALTRIERGDSGRR